MHAPVRGRRVACALLGALTLCAGSAILPQSVPGGSATAEAVTPAYHVVKPAQTLSGIAALYGMSYRALAQYNSIPYPYTIHVDGMLRLTKPSAPLPAFSYSIGSVTAARLGATYRSGCPVGPSSLRAVTVTYYGLDGVAHSGKIVVHYAVASNTVNVFRRLYTARFPIKQIVPVSVYGGSDAASMDANNTSAFNCRRKTGSTTSWSEHSYGRAIDLNPVQNPYVTGLTVLPSAGVSYTTRSRYKAGMVHAGGAVRPFTANSFYWGGYWSGLKDYQHFSTTNR